MSGLPFHIDLPRVVNIRREACDVYIGRTCRCGEVVAGRVPVGNVERKVDYSSGVQPGVTHLRVLEGLEQLGNPYRGGSFLERLEAVQKYADLMTRRLHSGGPQEELWRQRVMALAGKRLGCWCAPELFHGDVLVEILRELRRTGHWPTSIGVSNGPPGERGDGLNLGYRVVAR